MLILHKDVRLILLTEQNLLTIVSFILARFFRDMKAMALLPAVTVIMLLVYSKGRVVDSVGGGALPCYYYPL